MGKPHFDVFEKFWRRYQRLNEADHKEQSLVPYLMSSHPGCTERDMQALAGKVLGRLHFTLEQVQDLTPTPMTLSSVMFYTGENPYTGEKVYVARSQEEKRRQKGYFFRTAESGARPPQGRRTTAPKGVGRDSDTGKRDVRRSAPPHGKSRKR